MDILRSVLDEIDIVASTGAHRSTTYLAVSAIEGLCDEILNLLGTQPSDAPNAWPKVKNTYKKRHKDNFSLHEILKVLQAVDALPKDFEHLYDDPLRTYRNYIHPDREIREIQKQEPIARSVALLALAALNALIEKYENLRFAAGQKWRLEDGLAHVPQTNVILMPQNPGEYVSLLTSEFPAEHFREMSFRVIIPPDAIFNYVYNFVSLDQFMAARIEGRQKADGNGCDNGRLRCPLWRAWYISDRYESEPDPSLRQHTVKVVMDPSGNFTLTVDQVPLKLKGGAGWDFDPQTKVGFMTELGTVSIVDLEVLAR